MGNPLGAVFGMEMAAEITRAREHSTAKTARAGLILLGTAVRVLLHGERHVVLLTSSAVEEWDTGQLATVHPHTAGVIPHIACVALDEVALRHPRLETTAVQLVLEVLLDTEEERVHQVLAVLLDHSFIAHNLLVDLRDEDVHELLHLANARADRTTTA